MALNNREHPRAVPSILGSAWARSDSDSGQLRGGELPIARFTGAPQESGCSSEPEIPWVVFPHLPPPQILLALQIHLPQGKVAAPPPPRFKQSPVPGYCGAGRLMAEPGTARGLGRREKPFPGAASLRSVTEIPLETPLPDRLGVREEQAGSGRFLRLAPFWARRNAQPQGGAMAWVGEATRGPILPDTEGSHLEKGRLPGVSKLFSLSMPTGEHCTPQPRGTGAEASGICLDVSIARAPSKQSRLLTWNLPFLQAQAPLCTRGSRALRNGCRIWRKSFLILPRYRTCMQETGPS
ncbi:transmembrane protein 206 [Platysternon megacephalum]|uniref:Transmembrane protein 206 n=1 Tax=Platysternon megacephalum TaxID=55544 RepID=A0A4D9DSU8_9SAUR|nr:transmembrane protein 206 [Platysternon megacephalum]